MSATFGNQIRVTLFGQSHAPAIGAIVDGIPAGVRIDEEKLQAFMDRRRAMGELATQRHEGDKVIFKSGVVDSVTCGAPICMMIENSDTRSKDYSNISLTPRPSHSDYSAFVKYGGHNDIRGGGQFSGRLTAAMCAAGFLCLELLRKKGITIVSHVSRIGDISDVSLDTLAPDPELNEQLKHSAFPVIDTDAKQRMTDAILLKKQQGDSLGGAIECAVYGLPAGLGSDFFGGLEALIAQTVFSVPAVKGLEFGAGFEFAAMSGSEANDDFATDAQDNIITSTNNCGGILGGISSGMPLTFTAAFKPTPSIALPQKSVKLREKEETELIINGRHDPCIVPRAAAVVEAAAAMALVNADGFIL
ncbi:MAG: chorismate synthase [Clostridia bacterium]|nr:chorismate synthase [Clostridia bacterium]